MLVYVRQYGRIMELKMKTQYNVTVHSTLLVYSLFWNA